MMRASWRIGVDTGGTFTDAILWNEANGRLLSAKILSTPDDPSRAVFGVVDRLLQANGCDPGAVAYLVHGTTVATNAVLERRLAPAAFVTTRGFRDVLEIARQVRENAFDVFAEKPPALVPRHLCLEVDERLDASGAVVAPLDMGSVGPVAEVLRARLPGIAISLSSDLSSEFREFPRACTAIINAGSSRKSAPICS